MITLALSLGYALVALLMLRPLAGHLAWCLYRTSPNSSGPNPDIPQWLGAFCLAAVFVVAWPAIVVVWLSGRLLPKVGAERLAEIKTRERKLREAERELGL